MTQSINSEKVEPRILIVDDEDELRDLLSLKFTKIGFDVSVAACGQEAAQMIESSEYNAIICDLNLPDTPKGTDLYNLFCAKNKNSTFIAITGYTQDSPEVSEARKLGIKHVFSKPLGMRTIIELINQSR